MRNRHGISWWDSGTYILGKQPKKLEGQCHTDFEKKIPQKLVGQWDIDFKTDLKKSCYCLELLGGTVGHAFSGEKLKNWVDSVPLILWSP